MDERDRLEQAEAWFPFVARVGAFLLGAIVVLAATFGADVHPILLLGSIGLLGPAGMEVAAMMQERRGGQNE